MGRERIVALELERSLELVVALLAVGVPKEMVIFSRQFAVLMGAKVPMVQALKTMVKQTSHERFRKVVADVAAEVENGTPLSGAQLNAAAGVPGAFAYTPAAGAAHQGPLQGVGARGGREGEREGGQGRERALGRVTTRRSGGMRNQAAGHDAPSSARSCSRRKTVWNS